MLRLISADHSAWLSYAWQYYLAILINTINIYSYFQKASNLWTQEEEKMIQDDIEEEAWLLTTPTGASRNGRHGDASRARRPRWQVAQWGIYCIVV